MAKKLNTLVIYHSRQLRRQFEILASKLSSSTYLANGRAEGLTLMYRLRPDLVFLEIIADQDDSWEILSFIRLFTDTPMVLIADKIPDAVHRQLLVGNSILVVQPISAKKIASASRVVLAASKSSLHSSRPVDQADLLPSTTEQVELGRLTWIASLVAKAFRAQAFSHAVDQPLLDRLRILLDADWLTLYQSDPVASGCTTELESRSDAGAHWTEEQKGFLDHQAVKAVQIRHPIIQNEPSPQGIAADGDEHPPVELGPFAVVPLIGHDRVHGALAVAHHATAGKQFSPVRVEFIITVAETLALVMDNAALAQRTQEPAILDDVTGIYSNAYADHVIAAEKQRALRYGSNYSVVQLEWTNEQEYRQLHSDQDHAIMLRHIAGLSQRTARSSDVVARNGEGRIAFILPQTDGANAQRLADRLTRTFQSDFAQVPAELRPIIATQVFEQGSDNAELVRPPHQAA